MASAWRIATAFGPPIFATLALPMARQRPRGTAVSRILVAALAYLVVMNLMILTRTSIASGTLAAPIGMWWFFLPVFAGAAWVFARQYAKRASA